jgi:CRISPR-associated protein Csm4
MTVYRYRIVPRSAWCTPWHADTLSGRLCGVAGQLWGVERLQTELLDFFLAGLPPFVVSDAFPGELMPVPVTLRLLNWDESERKSVKRARWIAAADFDVVRSGGTVTADRLLPDDCYAYRDRLHNTIDRQTGTTGQSSLYSETEIFLNPTGNGEPEFLSLYARIERGFEDRFTELLAVLSSEGFGADASAGYGRFHLSGRPEALPHWYEQPGANGFLVLSTFQPAPGDPTDGFWEAFVKYGKLGPSFGGSNVFKRPIVLLRPGACFRSDGNREFVGRALFAEEFLEIETLVGLRERGVEPIHVAYGLTAPCKLT